MRAGTATRMSRYHCKPICDGVNSVICRRGEPSKRKQLPITGECWRPIAADIGHCGGLRSRRASALRVGPCDMRPARQFWFGVAADIFPLPATGLRADGLAGSGRAVDGRAGMNDLNAACATGTC